MSPVRPAEEDQMHHDQAAEMAAYGAELAAAEQRQDAAHARAVREQISLLYGSPAQLRDRAAAYDAAGREGSAARARALAAAVANQEQAAENAVESTAPPAAENAVSSAPKETAVTRRGKSKES